MKNAFNDKVIIVTGATSGIGKSLCELFCKKGAIVFALGRKKESLSNLQKEINNKNLHCVEFDINNYSKATELFLSIYNLHKKIDLLVNNAGISQRAFAMETDEAVERKIMETNFFANIYLAKSVIPFMKKNNEGKIVVISSIAGKFGFYLRSAYSASKHALHGYYESLRLEEEKNGITVLLVCPGKIATNMSINAISGDGSKHNKMDKQHLEGLSSNECARQILDGIIKNNEEILIGGREIKAVKLKRFFPKWFSKVIRKQPIE